MSSHVIIMLTTDTGGSTQYILTDISKSSLKERILGSQLALQLDIKNQEQVDELFSKEKTTTTGLLGVKQTITMEWCKCNDPSSHKRSDAAQLGQ